MPICKGCGNITNNNYYDADAMNNDIVWCHKCADEKNIYRCKECKIYFLENDMKSDGSGGHMCNECYDQYH